MTPDAHGAFSASLATRLEADAEVLGLVWLGSSSGLPPLPDAYSDHDFFVVTRPLVQERFRTQLGWLPNATEVVFSFRETAHGVKVLDRHGHLLEFAVFDLDELSLARVNRYRVAFDRADIAARLARVREATATQTAQAPDRRWLLGQFVTELVVGVNRAARGELLSAHTRVRGQAVQHLLGLLRAKASPTQLAGLDDLDRSRRFEQAFPSLGGELAQALELPLGQTARALLNVAMREFPEEFSSELRATLERVLPA